MGLIKNLDFVKEVTAEGETKTSIRTNKGLQVDVRVVKPEEFGSALQYFTGNKEHNVKLRTYAIGKGFKLNEYGLFKGDKRVAGETEESIYKALGMQIMPPELREGGKEIEVALKHKIPEVVELSDIKGDMHVHSNWSDGTDSVKAMADYCRDKLKYSYVCLTDHAGGLKIAGALTSKEIIQRQKEISDLNSTYSHFKIVNGCETDIKPDGSLTLPDKELAKFDYVIAGVHTSFNMGLAGMTKRLVTALKNERVNAIAHPTGRILLGRKPYLFNEDEVFSAAAKYGKCLEINAFFNRLDLPDTLAMKAKIFGAKFCIGTDAHAVAHLNYMNLGVAVARRAWLTKNDIINTKNIF